MLSEWRKYLLPAAAITMALAAALWLGYEFWRMLWQPESFAGISILEGAIDFRQRYREVNTWFSGAPVYGHVLTATYPPASYAMLWPFMGWLPGYESLLLWAASTIFALACLIYFTVRVSGAATGSGRLILALIPLSMYATGATLGNGQVTIHITAALMTCLFLLDKNTLQWKREIILIVAYLFALIKPSIAAPFFLIFLIQPHRARIAISVLCGYISITLFAASFQKTGIATLFHQWLRSAERNAAFAASADISHNNLARWFTELGIQSHYPFAALLLLVAAGLWVYKNRNCDLWLLAGVIAFAARLWTYHGWYDDLLLLFPIIVLVRIITGVTVSPWSENSCLVLLTLTMVTSVAPGGQYLFPAPWNHLYTALQMLVWMLLLIALVTTAHFQHHNQNLPADTRDI